MRLIGGRSVYESRRLFFVIGPSLQNASTV